MSTQDTVRFKPRNGFPGALAVAVAAALIAPSLSIAAGGGATAPAGSGGGGTTAPAAGTQAPPPAAGGGTTAPEPGTQSREERRRPPRKRRKRPTPPPSLTSFHAGASRFYDLGSPARIAFRIDGRSTTVRVKLLVLRAGKRIRTIDLGDRSTGRRHSIALTGREGGGRFPEGALQLRLTARDPRGRGLRASSRASATGSLAFYWHRFPLLGDFSYGGDGSRFGAGRPGHVHQGQDLSAAPGTPVVAPRGGVVRTVAYQAGGAGHYVVLEASGENRTYVFMHLLDGSVRVREGERVATGQRLADVGSTGSSSGPHLHFEIWAGAWQAGGRPLDPLPYLRRWDGWS